MTNRGGSSSITGTNSSSSVTLKVAAIVWAVSDCGDPSMTDVVRRTGLPPSTTYRLLRELVRGQLLEHSTDGRYRTNHVLHQRAHKRQRPRAGELRTQVCTVLDDLGVTTGGRARFGVWRGTDISYLERPAGTGASTCIAGLIPSPPHATALGQMLLAHGPSKLLDQVLGRGLPARSELTSTAVEHLKWSLAAARRNELAVIQSKLAHIICAAAVPVRGPDGTVVGALELTFDAFTNGLPRARASLLMAARGLARDLASRPQVLPTGAGDTPLNWRTDPTSPALNRSEPNVAG